MSSLYYLTNEQLIKHAANKGITFHHIPPQEAAEYLKKNNYYFKLSSYRKNFPKNQNGQYVNLDFAELIDLAVIDSYLRMLILKLALNIEHFSKVYLLSMLEHCDDENATQIVNAYLESKPENRRQEIRRELKRSMSSPYCMDLYDKYKFPYMPVWVFIELISFGSFIDFYQFCAKSFPSTIDTNLYYLLLETKKIRNASAHNNCIINDLRSPSKKNKAEKRKINFQLTKFLSSLGIKQQSRRTKLANPRIYQIVVCLYTHAKIVSSKGVQESLLMELQTFKSRLFKNFTYENSQPVSSTFNFLKTVIDGCYHSHS